MPSNRYITDPFGLQPYFRSTVERVQFNFGDSKQLLQSSARRSSFTIVYGQGLGTFYLWPTSDVGSTCALYVDSSNPFLTIRYQDYGPLVGGPWYAATPSGSGNVGVIAIEFDPAFVQ